MERFGMNPSTELPVAFTDITIAVSCPHMSQCKESYHLHEYNILPLIWSHRVISFPYLAIYDFFYGKFFQKCSFFIKFKFRNVNLWIWLLFDVRKT